MDLVMNIQIQIDSHIQHVMQPCCSFIKRQSYTLILKLSNVDKDTKNIDITVHHCHILCHQQIMLPTSTLVVS